MEKLKNKLISPEVIHSRLVLLTYISIALAVVNSNLHLNFNVIIGFVGLSIITKYYNSNTNHCIKLVFQINLLGIVIDKVKMAIISIYYLQKFYKGNEHWADIQTRISLYYYVNIIETLVNFTLLMMCYFFYKANFSIANCLKEMSKLEFYDFSKQEQAEISLN